MSNQLHINENTMNYNFDLDLSGDNMPINWAINRTRDFSVNLSYNENSSRDFINDIIESNRNPVERRRYFISMSEYTSDSVRNRLPLHNLNWYNTRYQNTWVNDLNSNWNNRNTTYYSTFNEIDNLSSQNETIQHTNEEYIPFNNPFITTILRNDEDLRYNIIIENFEISDEDRNCCICFEIKEAERICKLNCAHTFCINCMNQHLQRNEICPLCRTNITSIQVQNNNGRESLHI